MLVLYLNAHLRVSTETQSMYCNLTFLLHSSPELLSARIFISSAIAKAPEFSKNAIKQVISVALKTWRDNERKDAQVETAEAFIHHIDLGEYTV